MTDGIRAIIAAFNEAFEVPGLAVAILRPGEADLLHCHGVRRMGRPEPVDTETQFAIASLSKAFLAASLAMLVEAGTLGWDEPVVTYLPEFRMSDPAVTAMMTVRDLLVHRSGLPLGAGDLMQFPRTDHSREEILRALPHFKPATGFRAGYAYDNSLYIVAGLVLERVSGLSWDDFLAERIFRPLGMHQAVGNPTLLRSANRAGRHQRLGPPVIGMGPLRLVEPDESAVLGPAGGINLSLSEIVPWLSVQLGRGALPDGRRLWSEAMAEEMWRPQTIVSTSAGPTAEQPQRPVLEGYALGWGVADFRGRRMLSHGGGLTGQSSRAALLPEQGIGLAILSNIGGGTVVSGLRYAIIDHLLGIEGFDWIGWTRRTIADGEAQVRAVLGDGVFQPPAGQPSLPLERYAGRYRDPWYGDVIVAFEAGRLTVDFTRTPAFKGQLDIFGQDAFRTRFPQGAGEDAVLDFATRHGAVVGLTMRALSPIADFSFDFNDLAFVPADRPAGE